MPERTIATLRTSDVSFRTIIENNADAILLVFFNGVICYANLAAERLLGRSSGQLVGEPFGIPLLPGETTELDIPSDEHEARVAEMRVVEAVWEDQRVYLASLRDITERKIAGDALRFLAEASRLLAGSLDLPTTISSIAALGVAHLADWCIIDLLSDDGQSVKRALVTHCQTAKQPTAQQLCETWHPDWQSSEGLPVALLSGEPQVHHRPSQTVLSSMCSSPAKQTIVEELGCKSLMLVPLLARGRTLGAVWFISASESHRYRASDLALAKDLAHRGALALDNARLYDESQMAVRRRDEFLAMLAHELRNPLAAVQNAVDVIRLEGVANERQQRAWSVVERQGQHMGRLLDDLLDMARVMSGKIELQLDKVDLRSVARNALAASRTLIDARKHEATVDLDREAIFVHADATRLEQVLVNLLSNAAKYTPPGGNITVSAHASHGEAVLRVKDTGMGIAPESLASVFDLFVQASDSLARSDGGLGIGLTLVRQLVELHGGTVRAYSEGFGQGAEFVVRLKLNSADVAECDAASPEPASRRLKIVIVEDNPDAREMLSCLLEMEGHEVLVASDGRQGIDTILRNHPDVALVDIGLPGVDGFQVAQQVRSANGASAIRMVAITGYGQQSDRKRALEAGFDRHLVKPVKLAELNAVLQALV